MTLLKLPAGLEPIRIRLEDALDLEIPIEWPEGDGYLRAKQPKAVVEALMAEMGPHHSLDLLGVTVDALYREEMADGRLTILGKARKVSGLLAEYCRFTFIIEVNWAAWRNLTHGQRVALIDHELCHCAFDTLKAKPVMLPHDIEEFGAVVSRWGEWKPDLSRFAQALLNGPQLNLFEEPKKKGNRKGVVVEAAVAAANMHEDLKRDGLTMTFEHEGHSVTLGADR